VPPEDDDGDAARAGQLECGGHRLGAATGDPRVVYYKDIGAGDRIAGPRPARVNASGVDLSRHDGQPYERQRNA